MSKSKFERYSLFPIKFPTLYKFYEDQRDNFWVPKEVDLETDVKEWRENLTENDRYFLIHTLAFFAQADGIVLRNLDVNFSIDIDIPEASVFYGIQAGIEAIHWEMYGLLIQTLITDAKIRQKAFNAIEYYPCIRQNPRHCRRLRVCVAAVSADTANSRAFVVGCLTAAIQHELVFPIDVVNFDV